MTAVPRRRQLELQYEGKSFNRDISLVIPAKDFNGLDVDSFDPVVTEAISPPSLHVNGESPREGELVVIKDSSTKGWFLSEVLRVLPNLVEVNTSPRRLRRLRTMSIARFKNARKGSVRSASAELGTSVSESMSEGRLTRHPIQTTRTCKSGKES